MRKIFVALALSLAMAVPVSAATVNMKMTDWGETYYGPYSNWVGPYEFTVNGTPGVPVLCTDFWGPIDVHDSFEAYVGTLAPPLLTYAKFFQEKSEQLVNYQKAAWLYGQMALNQDQTPAIHFAIWEIFNPEVRNTYQEGGQALTEVWLAKAQSAVGTFGSLDWSAVRIYTPTGGGYQEFIYGTPAPIPIPAAAWLLGTGLVGLVALRRRKK